MIKAINLRKVYEDGTEALKSLNIEVKSGEIYSLLGANGAGKTTTVNLFLNYIKPTSGKALIDDLDVHKYPLQSKQKLAYIPEVCFLYQNLTAIQNLDLLCRLAGKNNYLRENYRDALERVGLQKEFLDKRIGLFSKGMRQKVMLAYALLSEKDNFFLDEPTSGLDPKTTREFLEILFDLKNKKKSILICTHDIFRAKEISSKIGIMKRGELVVELDPAELSAEKLEKTYLEIMSDHK